MRKLTIVFFDAGGGHRNAANALKSVIERQQRPWQVELLNLQELLDAIDPLQKVAHIRLQDGYNLILRKGWTRLTPQLLVLLHSAIRMWHRPIVRALERYWQQNKADLVLSVIPNFNRALGESVHQVIPNAPFVTLMTDFADYPPHFWVERESEYVICGTQRAVEQALCMFSRFGNGLGPSLLRYSSPRSGRRAAKIGIAPKLAHCPGSFRRSWFALDARHSRIAAASENSAADDHDLWTQ